jgi:hypothetical protein
MHIIADHREGEKGKIGKIKRRGGNRRDHSISTEASGYIVNGMVHGE